MAKGSHAKSTHTNENGKSNKGIRVITTLIIVLFIIAGGLGAYALGVFHKITNNPMDLFVNPFGNDKNNNESNNNNLDNEDQTGNNPEELQEGEQTKKIESKLLQDIEAEGYKLNENIITLGYFGVDVLKDRAGLNLGYRSDVIMLAAIDVKTKKIVLISIPRDTYTTVQKLDKEGKVTSYQKNKINAAFAFGGGRHKYSYQNTMEAVSSLFGGIAVNNYVGFDMDGMKAIVDAMGGVSIYMDVDFTSVGLDVPKGKTAVLNGEQALIYCRVRKGVADAGGDLGRIERQQKVVKAVMASIKKKNPIVYIPKLYKAIKPNLDTDLNTEQMAALAVILKDADLDHMEMLHLPGKNDSVRPSTSTNSISVWAYDEAALKELIKQVYFIKK